MWMLDIVIFAAGYAACWFSKDWMMKMIVGTENFVKALEARIKSIRS